MADEDAPAPSGGGETGKVSNPITDLILGIVTCGVYQVFWMYTRSKEINGYLGTQAINPMFIFPGCFCLPVLIYACFPFSKGVYEVLKKSDGDTKDETMIHAILLALIAPLGMWMIQQKLNDVWSK